MRKGYVYAIEGIIAGLLVVFYLGNMVQPPETTEWDSTVLNQRSGDLIEAFSSSGILQEVIVDGREDQFPVMVSAVGGDVDQELSLTGLPQRSIGIGVFRDYTDVMVSETDETTSAPEGVDESYVNGEERYRTGSIGGVDFYLSDTTEEGSVNYDRVAFNFDGGDISSYDDYLVDDGPYSVGDVFRGCFDFSNFDEEECDGVYQVGYVNTSLVVYNLTDLEPLVTREYISSGGLDISVSYRSFGIPGEQTVSEGESIGFRGNVGSSYEVSEINGEDGFIRVVKTVSGEDVRDRIYVEGQSFNTYDRMFEVSEINEDEAVLSFDSDMAFDVGITSGEGIDTINSVSKGLEDFLSGGNSLLMLEEFSSVEEEDFEDSFYQETGFSLEEGFSVQEEGVGFNKLDTEVTTGTSPYVTEFFTTTTHDFSGSRFNDNYFEFEFGGESYEVEDTYDDGVLVNDRQYKEGDSIILGGNRYSVLDTTYNPLSVQPYSENHRFSNFFDGANLLGEEVVLYADGWSFDFSGIDKEEGTTQITYSDPEDYGLPSGDSVEQQRQGGVEVNNEEFDFVITSIEMTGSDVFDYVNFDFTGDGGYGGDDDETGAGFSDEGPHPRGGEVLINGREYRVDFNDGDNQLVLEYTHDDRVPTGIWNSDVVRGNGDVFVLTSDNLNEEVASIMVPMVVKGSMTEHYFREVDVFGSPNIGTTFSNMVYEETYLPYVLDGVWWYK